MPHEKHHTTAQSAELSQAPFTAASNAAPIPVLCLVGATGAGKTAMAVHLASHLPITVINCDSRQVYRDFPIITAQPTSEEQNVCPHRMYGFMGIEEKMSAGNFVTLAAAEITAAHEAGRIPLLVGGTGLYVQALLQGLAEIPTVPASISAHWQNECERLGAPALHEKLQAIDPPSAARLHPNDRQRITRALEVWEATGQTLTAWHAKPLAPSPYRSCMLGIACTLDKLLPRLNTRIDIMLEMGALAEAKAAYEICRNPEAAGWSGIGCAELYAYITGATDFLTCREAWLHNTRAYAKRQLTWFKRDKSLHWLGATDFDAADSIIGEFL